MRSRATRLVSFAAALAASALLSTQTASGAGQDPPTWRHRPPLVDLTRAGLAAPLDESRPLPDALETVVPWDERAVLEVLPETSPFAGALIVRWGKSGTVEAGGGTVTMLEAPGPEIHPVGIRWQPGWSDRNGEPVELGAVARIDGTLRRYAFSRADITLRTPRPGYTIPVLDLDGDAQRQVVVDREDGQYLGHPTTVLLEDGRTILCAYPKGHGRGAVVMKRSGDGGLTWSERLEVPATWASSLEVPTLHRVIDPATGRRRLIMFSGLHPVRMAVSEDPEGLAWGELEPVGEWGGIVVMGDVVPVSDGRLLAMFHDDGRFFRPGGGPRTMTLYKTFSDDGGLSWSTPEVVFEDDTIHLCEPGIIRSPDGARLAVLLRENRRVRNSHVLFSDDEGATFGPPRELPAALTGDRHTDVTAPDGRLFIAFRDTALESATQGDWVAWVGTWDDLEQGREGQYRVRLKDNHHRWDCAYPGVELLPDGTIVTTTYGHWDPGRSPYILSVRLTLEELDRLANAEETP